MRHPIISVILKVFSLVFLVFAAAILLSWSFVSDFYGTSMTLGTLLNLSFISFCVYAGAKAINKQEELNYRLHHIETLLLQEEVSQISPSPQNRTLRVVIQNEKESLTRPAQKPSSNSSPALPYRSLVTKAAYEKKPAALKSTCPDCKTFLHNPKPERCPSCDALLK